MAALKNGEVQVVELFSSDGNVVSNNFVALTDNKHLEGADYIVPVIRKSVDTAGVAKVLEQHRRQADHGRHLEAEPRRHVAAGAARRSGPDLGELGQRLIRRPPTADRRPPDRRPPLRSLPGSLASGSTAGQGRASPGPPCRRRSRTPSR